MIMNVKEMKVAQSHVTSVAIKGKMLLRVNKKVLHWVILATNSEKYQFRNRVIALAVCIQ